jgi:DNA topoisomerase IA
MHKGIPMYTPELRAGMEQKIKDVAEGTITKEDAITIMKETMRENFIKANDIRDELIRFINDFIQENRFLRYD